MAPPVVTPTPPPTSISPVTIDAATRGTPYHTALTRPTAPPPRTARSAKLAIPRAPSNPYAQGRSAPPKTPKPPAASKGKANSALFGPITTKSAPTAAFPSFGDPVLDAQRRGLQAATDQSVAASQGYANQATTRLGELAQLAGMSSVNPATSGMTGAVAALPGIQAQDAQQQQLKTSALAVNTANEMPSLLRAQGVTNLQNFTEGVRQTQLKALQQQQTLLEHIYTAAVSAGNAQLAANARLAIGQLDAQTRQNVANTAAGATLGAAQIRAGASGKVGGYKGLTAAGYNSRLNQLATKTNYDRVHAIYNAKYTKDLSGNSVPVPNTGYTPAQYFDLLVQQHGLRPLDAMRLLVHTGGYTADPHGNTDAYHLLLPYLGAPRALAAVEGLFPGSTAVIDRNARFTHRTL